MSARKIFAVGLVILALGFFGVLAFNKLNADPTLIYKTELIQKGDITSFISTTGTLNPANSVKVSAQVSGLIKDVFVDFNSTVKEGQPLAQLHSEVYENQVNQARASLQEAQADAGQKHKVYRLYQTLADVPNRISQYELDNSKVEYVSASAQVSRARAELELAESNLESTIIRTPIDGVIISKNLNVGETATPTRIEPLFVIAEDLTSMELIANVSEADIGQINIGKTISFTVDTYPDEVFRSEVSQIRNSPVTRQNVVTYEIAVPINNTENKLKPGMTAYVKIIIDEKQNVLRVPNIALKFTPVSETMPNTSKHHQAGNAEPVTVWVLYNEGELKPVALRLGTYDNNFTQILEGELKEGDKVVAGVINKKDPILGSLISPQMNY